MVEILRWWKREGRLIGEFSPDPEMIFWLRRRFQGEATAAVDYYGDSLLTG